MKICSGCQKPLEAGTPDGLCPECLLMAGLGTGVDMGPDSEPESGRTPFVVPSLEEVARLFPQVEILGFIGRGGMGAVYKARQKSLDRVVAVKILPPGIGKNAAFAERFTREAKALARLNHPGIVTIHEFGQADGLFFFLMEFVDGVSLRHLMEVERISAREALSIVPQICDALQYAHDQGIVHRDIKPENILLDRLGRVKVADFGLAKLVGTDAGGSPLTPALSPGGGEGVSALTEAGKVMGTPQYMAPEQREHPTEVDHRADIYSLGVVFYQMLTGELPGKPIEAPSRRGQVDGRLDDVVLRAMEKEPQRRYQQVSQMRTAVETIAGTLDPEVDPSEVALVTAAEGEAGLAASGTPAKGPPAHSGANATAASKRGKIWLWVTATAGLVILAGGFFVFAVPRGVSFLRALTGPRAQAPLVEGSGQGKPLRGVVLTEDGKALNGAQIILATPEAHASVYGSHDSGKSVGVSSSGGEFVVTNGAAKAAILITSEAGYALVTRGELEENPKITVQPWGRIEGVLRIGSSPAANQVVNLGIWGSQWYWESSVVSHNTSVTTDERGRFTFARVAPGDAWLTRRVQVRPGQWRESGHQYVKVLPGQTNQVELGGTGRALVGRVVWEQPGQVVFSGSSTFLMGKRREIGSNGAGNDT